MAANKLVYWLLAFVAGAALSLEVAFGGVLGQTIGKLETSWLIFVAGVVVLLPYVLLRKRESLKQLKALHTWELCGGFLGATYLVLLLVCVTKVGVGLSMTAVIVGQLAMGAVLEQFGWINLKVSKFNYNTLTAFILLVAALLLIVAINTPLTLFLALWIIVPVFAGTLLTVQAAVNGSLGQKAGTHTSTLVSFFVGTVALGIVVLFAGGEGLHRWAAVPGWQWITLVWGVMFVFLMVLVVPKIGVVVTTVLVIIGQLAVSMLVDHFGLFGNAVIPFGGKRLIGLLLMLAALYFIFRAKKAKACDKGN